MPVMRLLGLFCLLLVCGLCACGDDKPKPASVGTQNPDASDDMDAGADTPTTGASDSGSTSTTPDQSMMLMMMQRDAMPLIFDAATPREAGADAAGTSAGADAAVVPRCNTRACRAAADECHIGRCDFTINDCVFDPRPDGYACGSQAIDNCSFKDSCQSGACVPNDATEGTPCGDQNKDCHLDDSCDGAGHCVDKGLKDEGTACGDQTTNTICDPRDSCAADGSCKPNYAPVDTVCADDHMQCKYPDLCDGQGHCIDSGDVPQPCP